MINTLSHLYTIFAFILLCFHKYNIVRFEENNLLINNICYFYIFMCYLIQSMIDIRLKDDKNIVYICVEYLLICFIWNY